jgi:CheY-like chemotaxis protein
VRLLPVSALLLKKPRSGEDVCLPRFPVNSHADAEENGNAPVPNLHGRPFATRQEAFDAGCIAYLRKPFLSKLLVDAINQIP